MHQSQEFKLNKSYYHLLLWAAGLWSLFLIGIPLIIFNIIMYKTTRIIVDAKGVTLRSGWLTVTHRNVPFNKVNNVDIKQGLVGKKYDYGTITIRTGNDSEKILLNGVDRPFELKRIIEERIR